MLICDWKRSVLLLCCVASVLLSGCVSKGKYNELEGQYTDLQGQYRQLQQSSAAQAQQSAAELAAAKREASSEKAQIGRFQEAIKFTLNSDLLFRPGSWEISPRGKDLIGKMVPKLAPYQQNKLVVNGYTDNAP